MEMDKKIARPLPLYGQKLGSFGQLGIPLFIYFQNNYLVVA